MTVTPTPAKAAQYVRMSTDKQIYSTANQKAAIATYAATHDYQIVRTYADEGRSGLRLKGRIGLQDMLRDVLSGSPGFRAILVFDVSRWGRFQDTDESAHLEWICRSAGVQVHYCAELFENDGSLASTIVKNLRRAMAGEFSRDLSAKVWTAQCRLVALGYKMGGKAGYGLRRLLVDRDGIPKQLLEEGEHKSIASDRIILVPGAAEEVATVRRMFRLAERGLSNPAIAEILNSDGVPAPMMDKWNNNTIRQMLRAERYVGDNVFNKRSAKLGARYVHNPQAQWVRREAAFAPIVSARLFRKVQRLNRSAAHGYSDAELLSHLRRLLAEHHYLSSALIDGAAPPASKTYTNRFGSLVTAYAHIGYDVSKRVIPDSVGQAAFQFASEVGQILTQGGSQVRLAAASNLLTADTGIIIAPVVANLRTDRRGDFWRVRLKYPAETDVVVAALTKGAARQDIYIFPAGRFGKSNKIDVRDGPNLMENFRLWSTQYLREMALRMAEKSREKRERITG